MSPPTVPVYLWLRNSGESLNAKNLLLHGKHSPSLRTICGADGTGGVTSEDFELMLNPVMTRSHRFAKANEPSIHG